MGIKCPKCGNEMNRHAKLIKDGYKVFYIWLCEKCFHHEEIEDKDG